MVAGDQQSNNADQHFAVYEAALAIARETDPEAVLQRIVDLARDVVPARYAALGVADETGRIIHFVTSGITAAERARLGPIPEGHGLLRELIIEGEPLMIPDIAADSRSVGFPPNHPPMRTLLGVPILLGEQVLGNLYLTERNDGEPFDEADLHALQMLAVHAAAAIDRAHAYHRVEEQRDQLRIIVDSLPAGVMILRGPEPRIELINRALSEMIFGPASPPGRLPVYNRDMRVLEVDGAPLPTERRPAIRAMKGEIIRNQQILVENARGERIPVLTQAVPLPDAGGTVERAVLVLQDITRLREAEQLKDDFLSLVSHEFRTPLTTIHGGAHLLINQGEELDAGTRYELLCDIVAESNRLDNMLANMLILTNIMAGRLEPRTEPILVGPLVRKAVAALAAKTRSHAFVVDIMPDLRPAEGDPALLLQVLGNLYQNAVKYSPGGGEIHTAVKSNPHTVTIEIADEGIGMTDDEVDRVFDRFYRTGADPSVRGTGLGLYLSRHLVNAMGGQVRASSAGPGRGALFTVTLPAALDWMDLSHEEAATKLDVG